MCLSAPETQPNMPPSPNAPELLVSDERVSCAYLFLDNLPIVTRFLNVGKTIDALRFLRFSMRPLLGLERGLSFFIAWSMSIATIQINSHIAHVELSRDCLPSVSLFSVAVSIAASPAVPMWL